MAAKKQPKKSNIQRVRSVKTKAPTVRKNTTTKKKKPANKATKTTLTKEKTPQGFTIMTPEGVLILEAEFHKI